jgi:hypothetical protein
MNAAQMDLRFDVCAGRHGGSPESQAAFREHRGGFAKRRGEVLAEIRKAGAGGLTAKELARIWAVGLNTISGRFSELKMDHEIVVVRDPAGRAVRRDGCAAYRTN